MPLRHVRFLNSGYCTQVSYLAGRRSFAPARFHAVFVVFEHPIHGTALVDTGYSPHFRKATEPFPERFYRWLTPVQLDRLKTPSAILAAHGIQPDRIQTLFVSHFHGDHIAGLRDFPGVRFVYRGAALDTLTSQGRLSQVRHGFLAGLLPADFRERGQTLAEREFLPGKGDLTEFRTLDFWGDGSLLLVDLPGHAEGHTGYILQTVTERIFYIVDATWDLDVMCAGRSLPGLSRGFQQNYPAYVLTLDKLRRLAERGGYRMVACHCPRTQEIVGQEISETIR